MFKKQFSKFILIGVVSTVFNYLFFYILLTFFSVNYMIASAVGFMVGVFVGYFFNKNWTFEVKEKSKTHVIKYYVVYLMSLVLSLLFLKLTVGCIGISAEVANVASIGLTTCTNFVGIKIWVFTKR